MTEIEILAFALNQFADLTAEEFNMRFLFGTRKNIKKESISINKKLFVDI